MKKQNKQKLIINLMLLALALIGIFFTSQSEAKETKVKRVKIDFTKPIIDVNFENEPLTIIGTVKK